jgi:hypothetical protein
MWEMQMMSLREPTEGRVPRGGDRIALRRCPARARRVEIGQFALRALGR